MVDAIGSSTSVSVAVVKPKDAPKVDFAPADKTPVTVQDPSPPSDPPTPATDPAVADHLKATALANATTAPKPDTSSTDSTSSSDTSSSSETSVSKDDTPAVAQSSSQASSVTLDTPKASAALKPVGANTAAATKIDENGNTIVSDPSGQVTTINGRTLTPDQQRRYNNFFGGPSTGGKVTINIDPNLTIPDPTFPIFTTPLPPISPGQSLNGQVVSMQPFQKATGAQLSGSTLVGNGVSSTFDGANLVNADLSKADLTFSTFNNANLSGANLSNSSSSGQKFNNANLSGANLSGARPTFADFSGANLSSTNLAYTDLSTATVTGANLTGAKLNRTQLPTQVISNPAAFGLTQAQLDANFPPSTPARDKATKLIDTLTVPDNAAQKDTFIDSWTTAIANPSTTDESIASSFKNWNDPVHNALTGLTPTQQDNVISDALGNTSPNRAKASRIINTLTMTPATTEGRAMKQQFIDSWTTAVANPATTDESIASSFKNWNDPQHNRLIGLPPAQQDQLINAALGNQNVIQKGSLSGILGVDPTPPQPPINSSLAGLGASPDFAALVAQLRGQTPA